MIFVFHERKKSPLNPTPIFKDDNQSFRDRPVQIISHTAEIYDCLMLSFFIVNCRNFDLYIPFKCTDKTVS